MKLQSLLNSKKYAVRLTEIVRILSRYGLAHWLSDSKIDFIQARLKDQKGTTLDSFSDHQNIRKAFEELGPTFIKFGQILSTRPDVVGKDLAHELSNLQGSTPPDGKEWVETLIREEFGKEPDECFREFNYRSIASASIGQVHEAVTYSGDRVAVKIIHQGIEETMRTDLELLIGLAELAGSSFEIVRKLNLETIVREFKRTLLNELDFHKEANNIQRMKSSFSENRDLVFPTVFSELSTSRILTLSFEEGIPLNKLDRSAYTREELRRLAEIGSAMYLDMIFRDNFYHADPHPGNLLLNKSGELIVLDFGMVGSIDAFMMEDVEDLMLGIVRNDPVILTDSLYKLCEISKDTDRRKLASEIDYWLKEYVSQDLENVDMARALNEFNTLIRDYEIVLPGSLALLFKVVVQLDALGRLLDPGFNVNEVVSGYYGKILRNRMSPKNIALKLIDSSRDWFKLLNRVPKAGLSLIDGLEQKKLNLDLQHKGLESSVNRLVLGIISVSIFLGSVVLWSFKVPPLIWNASAFGVIGYFFAVVLIIKLIKDIFKS